MTSILRRSLLIGLLGLLAACSSDKPKELKPSPLPKIAKTEVYVDKHWSYRVGDGDQKQFSLLRPALTEKALFSASVDGTLQANALDSGKRLWRIATGATLTTGVEAGYGLVLVTSTKGEVLAYDVEDGKKKWTASLAASALARPLVSANRVIICTGDGRVLGLDRVTGEQRWVFETQVPPLELRNRATPVAVGDQVVIGTGMGRVVGLDLESGEPHWEARIGATQGRSELERMIDVSGDLLLDNDSLYAVSYQGSLVAMDAESGKHRWDYTVSSWQALSTGLGNVYVVTPESVIVAVDAISGKVVWQQADLKGRKISASVVVGNYLVVADFEGYVHVLAQSDGRWVGREHFYRTGGFMSAPLVHDSDVYVQSRDGRVIAFDLRNAK